MCMCAYVLFIQVRTQTFACIQSLTIFVTAVHTIKPEKKCIQKRVCEKVGADFRTRMSNVGMCPRQDDSMYVCMYMHMYVYTYVCMYVCIYVCMHACRNNSMHVICRTFCNYLTNFQHQHVKYIYACKE